MGVRVKVFDEEHEEDLEEEINSFLEKLDEADLIDIKYQIAVGYAEEEQVYCFSAMILYRA